MSWIPNCYYIFTTVKDDLSMLRFANSVGTKSCFKTLEIDSGGLAGRWGQTDAGASLCRNRSVSQVFKPARWGYPAIVAAVPWIARAVFCMAGSFSPNPDKVDE